MAFLFETPVQNGEAKRTSVNRASEQEAVYTIDMRDNSIEGSDTDRNIQRTHLQLWPEEDTKSLCNYLKEINNFLLPHFPLSLLVLCEERYGLEIIRVHHTLDLHIACFRLHCIV